MKTMAIIKNGLVVNCVVWDETREWNPGEEFTIVEITGMSGVGIGSLYIDGVFSNPQAEE